jgi:hypothetical protein
MKDYNFWDAVSERAFEKYPDIFVTRIECSTFSSVCNGYDIKKFPSIVWLTFGKITDEYSGVNKAESLLNYVDKMWSEKNQNDTKVLEEHMTVEVTNEKIDVIVKRVDDSKVTTVSPPSPVTSYIDENPTAILEAPILRTTTLDVANSTKKSTIELPMIVEKTTTEIYKNTTKQKTEKLPVQKEEKEFTKTTKKYQDPMTNFSHEKETQPMTNKDRTTKAIETISSKAPQKFIESTTKKIEYQENEDQAIGESSSLESEYSSEVAEVLNGTSLELDSNYDRGPREMENNAEETEAEVQDEEHGDEDDFFGDDSGVIDVAQLFKVESFHEENYEDEEKYFGAADAIEMLYADEKTSSEDKDYEKSSFETLPQPVSLNL